MTDKLYKKARHEASHAIIGRFFSHYLLLNSVSLEPQEHHATVDGSKQWTGVVNISIKKKPLDSASAEALVFSLWAGFIGQNIAYYGPEAISKRRGEIYADANKWYSEGCDEDYKIIEYLTPYCIAGSKMSKAEHHILSFSFLIKYFLDKGAWKYVERLASKLEADPKHFFKKEELEKIFKEIGFLRFLRWNRYRFMCEFNHRLNLNERFFLFKDTF